LHPLPAHVVASVALDAGTMKHSEQESAGMRFYPNNQNRLYSPGIWDIAAP
jgi:hypothetical protein